MKTLLLTAAVPTVLFASACGVKTGPIKPPAAYTVYSVEEAIKDIKNLTAINKTMIKGGLVPFAAGQKDTGRVYAYTIRASDLFAAMGMSTSDANSDSCKYAYCRAYLGYNDVKGYKLFLVPVAGANLDPKVNEAGYDLMIDSSYHVITDTSNHDYSKQCVLDLNAPCPSICDKHSPLYQAAL